MIIEDIINSRDKFCESFDNNCSGCPFAFDDVMCHQWSTALRKLKEWQRKREKTFAEHFLTLCPNAMTNDKKIPCVPVFLIYPQAKSWEEAYHE